MRHVRIPVNERETIREPCPYHTGESFAFYCLSCKLPLCKICQSQGSHAYGPAALHAISPLPEVYSTALLATEQAANVTTDPDLERINIKSSVNFSSAGDFSGSKHLSMRWLKVQEQLQVLENVMQAVRANSLETEERSIAVLEDALRELQMESERDMARLMGDHIEIKRQLDQLEWAEDFIRKLREALPPADFLYSW